MLQGESMKAFLALAMVCLAVQDADVPYTLPTPEGWRTERMTFPLGFAKDLEYQGHEDLRFAPGMFKADAADYFSYAFVLWIDGKMSFEAKSLEQDLLKYYKGLCGSVAKGKKLDLDLSKIVIEVTKQEKKGTL